MDFFESLKQENNDYLHTSSNLTDNNVEIIAQKMAKDFNKSMYKVITSIKSRDSILIPFTFPMSIIKKEETILLCDLILHSREDHFNYFNITLHGFPIAESNFPETHFYHVHLNCPVPLVYWSKRYQSREYKELYLDIKFPDLQGDLKRTVLNVYALYNVIPMNKQINFYDFMETIPCQQY
jgi:hypothetical protein